MGIVSTDPVDKVEGSKLLKNMGATAAATATTYGTVQKGAAVANCTVAADGTSAGTQLNALLASLRAANIIS